MSNIKYITPDTDLSRVLHPVRWDVVVGNEPYKVFDVFEENLRDTVYYIHSTGGHWGDNSYWCCPRDEEPSYDNLVPFEGQAVCWGVNVVSRNGFNEHLGDICVEHSYRIEILRNGEVFNEIRCNDVFYGISKAKTMIEEYGEHPLELMTYGFEQNCVGRKVRYNGMPAVIKRYVHGQACVMIAPAEGVNPDEFFRNPHKTEDEYIEDFYEECKQDGTIKVDILSDHIWWWKD